MDIPSLSEATLRTHSSADSYSRGRSYYERGAVIDMAMRGNLLEGAVEGSQYTPYRVRVGFDAGGVSTATCTCPYDYGGWCKHIVALLLAALYDSAAIETRPPLAELLAELDRAQLQALLITLAERDADLAGAIERQVGLLRLANAAPQPAQAASRERQAGGSARHTAIDQAAIRQQVRFVMRVSERDRYDDYDYYDEEDPGDEVVANVRPILEQARGFIAGGDAGGALDILAALTEEYLAGYRALADEWEEIYGYGLSEGSAGEFFGELAESWTEAILSADLGADQRDEWGEKLAGWNDQAEDAGAGTPFDIAVTAADQGWEYPPLLRVLSGEITDTGAWEDEAPDYADELALARLRVLERQGRQQEYLYLAQAEGQIELYVVMLAKMGRVQEAVGEAIEYLKTPHDLLEVAKALRERGELEGALRVAEHGLSLKPAASDNSMSYYAEPGMAELASWAADLATGMGQRDRALRATEAAFRIAPSLATYLKAQDLAGERWDAIKPALLAQLRQSHAAEAKVDVFLHELLIDDAIAAVKDSYGYGLLERVMDAAIATRPDWVIKAANAQAERIMDAGQAQHYEHAVSWLRRAREAYRAAGRMADWQGYLGALKTKHGRKYKLMGLIQGL
jgi:uncharacterized Zn finger protein